MQAMDDSELLREYALRNSEEAFATLDRLQALLKAEVVSINMHDIELFRPPEEWTQGIVERQQRILIEATGFLTPSQLDTLKSLAAYDLTERQKQMADRRTALGIK